MWEIIRYEKSRKQEWDNFVDCARNSTFLFKRDYMDYHEDRFSDFSLLAYRNGKLSAILPANIAATTLYSHQGLTYGGWIFPPGHPDATDIFMLWRCWLEYCNSVGIDTVIYKPLPDIYAQAPSEEDRYMLWLSKAVPEALNLSSTINLRHNPGFNTLQRRHFKKSEAEADIESFSFQADSEKLNQFYSMLQDCLHERHQVVPVHSVEELSRLIAAFPENIRIWQLNYKKRPAAAVCAYISPVCVHCQYIATTAEGREMNVLASLFKTMIDYYGEQGYEYFDFGISNEEGGIYLNKGLNRQKTSYGATGTVYATYRINVSCALESLPISLWPPR